MELRFLLLLSLHNPTPFFCSFPHFLLISNVSSLRFHLFALTFSLFSLFLLLSSLPQFPPRLKHSLYPALFFFFFLPPSPSPLFLTLHQYFPPFLLNSFHFRAHFPAQYIGTSCLLCQWLHEIPKISHILPQISLYTILSSIRFAYTWAKLFYARYASTQLVTTTVLSASGIVHTGCARSMRASELHFKM